ncbi:MAG: hypothetical protein KAF27_01370 [Porphyrobacter sp.]|nr:hypothetical protein [Porphyrobacter sp.]
MNWVDDIKKTKIRDLEVFSKTGTVTKVDTRTSTSVSGNSTFVSSSTTHMTDFLIETGPNKEISVQASANIVAREGHVLTVFYLCRAGTDRGNSIAYFNHNTERLVFDYTVSGSADGHYRPDLNGGGVVVEGCLALIIALVATAMGVGAIGWVLGVLTPIVLFGMIFAVALVMLRKYAFQGPRKRVDHIRQLVEVELAIAKAKQTGR